MDHHTRQLVQESWTKINDNPDKSADIFYSKLFALDPSIQYLFRGDLGEQKKKLMGMFNIAVRGLDKLDAMLPTLTELGRRHAGYKVMDEHYDTMGKALVHMVAQVLGEESNEEIEAAWGEAYRRWADTMKDGSANAR